MPDTVAPTQKTSLDKTFAPAEVEARHYEAWEKVGFAPEVRLMEALREIEGITVVEAQSFIANQ